MDQKVEAVPRDMHTITPHIVCAGASEAIAFYIKAFGATEMARMPMPDGKLMHAMIKIGDSNIMLVDEMPEWKAVGPKTLNGTPVTLHMYVPDADAAFKRAIDAGATSIMPVEETFWGDRYGVLQDPFGHQWSIATHVRDRTPEEMQKAMQEMPNC